MTTSLSFEAHSAQAAQLGTLPEDWPVAALQDLAWLERGKFSARPRNDPKYFGGAVPFIQTGDVTNASGVIRDYKQTLSDDGVRVSKVFPKGTLFFTIAANIGDVGFTTFDTACPDSLIAISPGPRVDPKWLYHELKSRKQIFEGLSTQNAQLNINLEKLRPYELAVPPFDEQKRIAGTLSDIEQLEREINELIAKKRDLKQAAMQQLLTCKRRLPGFNAEWQTRRLGELLTYEQPTKYLVSSEEFSDTYDVPVLTAGKTFVLGYTKETAGIVTDLPVIIFDDFTTASKYVTFPFKAKSSAMKLLRLRDSSFELKVLYEMIQLIDFKLGDHKRYWISEFQHLNVRVPGAEEQTAIAAVLTEMDSELAMLAAFRAKTLALKQAMMQQLLTGRIRLI